MTTVLATTKRPENFNRRERIIMPDGTDFYLLLKQPTFEFHIGTITGAANWNARFEKIIVGWEGVNTLNEHGEEVELGYSLDSFKTICENYIPVFNQAVDCILRMLNEMPPTEKTTTKNSEPPSGKQSPDGGTKSVIETEKVSSTTSGRLEQSV